MPLDRARNCNIGSVSTSVLPLLLCFLLVGRMSEAEICNNSVAVVKFATEQEAARSISELDGKQFSGQELRLERLNESELWKEMVSLGRVDERVVERLECLELVGSESAS